MRPFRVIDSDLGLEYPEHSRYATSYEPIWQAIKYSCRGQWSVLATARVCCARLKIYMDRGKVGNDRAIRVWRVFNLLNGIPYNKLGECGIHAIEYAAADYFLEFAAIVRDIYHSEPYATEWDWAITRQGLISLCKRNPEKVMFMFRDLRRRPLRYGKPKLELNHYLDMIIEILNQTP